jgi:serine protease Do
MKLKVFYIILSLVLIAGTVFSSGCVITFHDSPLQVPDSPSVPTETSPIKPDWSTPAVENRSLELPSFATVIEQAYPSVVSINTETVTLDIFSQPRTQQGAGSGWVLDNIDGNSYIVTNNHVVEGAEKVMVETVEGKTYEATPSQIRRDPVSDIAVIELKNVSLQPAKIGDSGQLHVGDFVVALGNPLGQGLRAKEGTVSGLKVTLPVDESQYLYDLIETSAAINPGNSGGPLINLGSEVIGITSAKMAAVGVEGMGYAISIKTALPIIEELITRGYVIRPYMGIATRENNEYLATVNRLSSANGLIVAYLDPAGPASQAGLLKLDIITSFNGNEVKTPEELVKLIHAASVGDSVEISFIRGNETKTITVTLSETPPPK